MKLATGNDLVTGDVVWWTGAGWSRDIADAVDTGAAGEALIAAEEAALRVNAPYVIDATPGTPPRPAHIKDRIRAAGPTVRADLGVRPADADRRGWVL